MSEEEKKEDKHKIKTSRHLYKYFAITSFALGLFSFMMMLYFWIDVFVDVPYRFDSVLICLNIRFSYAVFNYIVLILQLLAILSTFLAIILGIWAYSKMTYKENQVSKILALFGIVLSLFHWALVFLQYTEWARGYLV